MLLLFQDKTSIVVHPKDYQYFDLIKDLLANSPHATQIDCAYGNITMFNAILTLAYLHVNNNYKTLLADKALELCQSLKWDFYNHLVFAEYLGCGRASIAFKKYQFEEEGKILDSNKKDRNWIKTKVSEDSDGLISMFIRTLRDTKVYFAGKTWDCELALNIANVENALEKIRTFRESLGFSPVKPDRKLLLRDFMIYKLFFRLLINF